MAKKTTRKAAKKKKAVAKKAKKTSAKKAGKKAAAKSVKKSKKASVKTSGGTQARRKRLKKSPLTKSQLKEFRELLLGKRRDLIGDMNGIEAEAFRGGNKNGGSDLSNMPTHPADIGTDNYEHEFTLGLLESERSLLGEIEQALERIENGTFGICLGTGEPIGLPRLRARPWAKYSIEYARLLEKGLVHAGSDQLDEDDLDADDSDDGADGDLLDD